MLFLILMGWAVADARAGEKLEIPELDPVAVEDFVASHDAFGLLYLQKWTLVDAAPDAELGGLSGELIRVVEYEVRHKSQLENAALIITRDSPRSPLKRVEAVVSRGQQKFRYQKKNLRWTKWTQQSNGVVYLDGQESAAFIPDIRVGDRIKITKEFGLKGIFGLGQYVLGNRDAPCLQSGLMIQCRKQDDWVLGILGAKADKNRLKFSRETENRNFRNSWIMSADPDGSLPSCGGAYPSVRVTPHLVATGREIEPNVAVGKEWANVGEAYLQRIEGVFLVDEALKAKALELTAGSETSLEKIDRLYRHVQRSCHYLGLFEGMGGMIPVPATQVANLGYGDCKGLATLLISMIRAIGIEAHPVLVLTRGGGTLDSTVPSLTQFNHYIAWADDGQGGVYLDATTDQYPAGVLPVADTAWPVLLLRPGQIALVDLPPELTQPDQASMSITGFLDLTTQGNPHLALDYEYTLTGNLAARWRGYLSRNSDQKKIEAIAGILLPSEPVMLSTKCEVRGMDGWSHPLVLAAHAESTGPLPNVPGRVFLPRVVTSAQIPSLELPACQDSLDLRSATRREVTLVLRLPEGMALTQTDSTRIETEGFVWREEIYQEGPWLRMLWSFAFLQPYATRDEAQVMANHLEEIKQARMGYLELRH